MANAMLEEDFKSSHADLVTLDQQDQQSHQQQIYCFDTDLGSSNNMDRKPKATLTATSRTKSVDFAILPPPMKRTRLASATWTPKQVVDGKGSSVLTRLDCVVRKSRQLLAQHSSTLSRLLQLT